MPEYKIRGSGDTREVFDAAGTLIGRVHRRTQTVTTMRIVVGKSASFRKTILVAWIATYGASDERVRWPRGTREPIVLDTLKAWRDPYYWSWRQTPESPEPKSPDLEST